ncbi:GNAT family N-acetyltransferase [Chitinimonas sp.]|uniref:GNAT family N-acetyltransferase n=1 Tax=Chitinimonas sp. TaxID=1934313 RepID=UPI002F91C95B
MSEATLVLTWQPAEAELQVVKAGVTNHGRALAGNDARPVACFARQAGRLLGGAIGRLERGRLFVEYLWVEERRRGQGLGSRLLAALEEAAKEAGANSALLDTLLDDTAALYQRRGYAVLAQVPDYVPGFNRWILLKPLGPV